MNCIDCKYFKKIDYTNHNDHIGIRKSLRDKGYGHCISDKIGYGMTNGMGEYEAVLDAQNKPIKRNESSDELLFEDNEGYAADLIIGPHFGCKHFEAKS